MTFIDWIWNNHEQLLAAVGSVAVACEGTALALLGLAKLLAVCARFTPWQGDDDFLARAIGILDAFAGWIPRLRSKRKPPEDAVGPLMAVLLAIGVATMSGCGGSGLEATRTAASIGALGAVAAHPIVAAEYDRAREAFGAGLLSESAYESRLDKLDVAERALQSLGSALTAVDLAVAAFEAGQECGLRPAIDGAVDAVREVVEALDAAGLDPPTYLSNALGLASVFVDAPVCEVSP